MTQQERRRDKRKYARIDAFSSPGPKNWCRFEFRTDGGVTLRSYESDHMLGLHPIDWLILLLYVAAIIGISLGVRRRIRNTRDYYQADRSFGRILTAFLTFGTMTDAGQAASVGREIYRQGLPGIWFANLVLFHTPFQWFIAAWQRRARYIGPGDLFRHRYESRFLAGLYALILLLSASYGSTIGFILTGKTLQAMMVVPEAEYSPADSAAVAGFERDL